MPRGLLLIAMLAAAAFARADQPPCVPVPRAQCRTVEVPENRALAGSRMLTLGVVVIPAVQARDAEPLFVLPGGPGQMASELADWAAEHFADANKTRDLVFVDYRGATPANFLRCPTKGSQSDPAGYFTDILSGDVVARCREQLSQQWDLTQYTTANIVEDLDAARKALHYQRVNIFGTSYGTRVAQEWMRRHPASIRSSILKGVVPPGYASPETFAADAERSMTRVIELCAEDEACRKAYPDLAGDYRRMLARIREGAEITIQKPAPLRTTLSRGLLGEILRNGLYSQPRFVNMPRLIHAAAAGDYAPVAALAPGISIGLRQLAWGLFLSVTCTEDIPRLDVAGARAKAAGTLLDSYRIDIQRSACRQWVRGPLDPRAAQPVRSSIPTLVLSGEVDPVTPPRFGDEVVRSLPHGRHLVVPYASHGGAGDCLDRLTSRFLANGSVDGLDDSCLKNEPRPVFVTGS